MKEIIRSYIQEGTYSPSDGLNYWRERIFKSILLVILAFGAFPYGFGMYMSISEGLYLVAVIDTLVYGFIIFSVLTKYLSLANRVYVIITLVYFIGVALTILVGKDGAGFNYIIGAIVLSALLLGLKGAINSLLLTLLTIGVIALGLYFGVFGDLRIVQYRAVEWITVSINVVAVGALSSIPLAVLLKGLESTIEGQKSLQGQLTEKLKQLKKAKQKASFY